MSYAKKVPAWMQQVVTFPGAMTGARSGPFCSGPEVLRAVYGDLFDPNSGLTAFAYLWRRFGPPWHGCDDHKDLVGYFLHTSHPEVVLSLHLSGSALDLAPGYLVTKTFQQEIYAPRREWMHRFEAWWVAHKASAEERYTLGQYTEEDGKRSPVPPPLAAIASRFWDARYDKAIMDEAERALGAYPYLGFEVAHPLVGQAITDALEELLRPVFIRDVPITILGRFDETNDWPEDYEEAPVSPYAGLGVPQEAVDGLLQEEQ